MLRQAAAGRQGSSHTASRLRRDTALFWSLQWRRDWLLTARDRAQPGNSKKYNWKKNPTYSWAKCFFSKKIHVPIDQTASISDLKPFMWHDSAAQKVDEYSKTALAEHASSLECSQHCAVNLISKFHHCVFVFPISSCFQQVFHLLFCLSNTACVGPTCRIREYLELEGSHKDQGQLQTPHRQPSVWDDWAILILKHNPYQHRTWLLHTTQQDHFFSRQKKK